MPTDPAMTGEWERVRFNLASLLEFSIGLRDPNLAMLAEALRADLGAMQQQLCDQVTCSWHRDGEGGWQGSCGIRIDDQPVRSGQVRFCSLCGKPVAW